MRVPDALAFVKRHGVVLMSARGPVPSLAEAIAGAPLHGSWWGHPEARAMFAIFSAVAESRDILACRLVGGKVTYVHRRLWPALVRAAGRVPRRDLAAIREEHTAGGRHRVVATSFPRWVPASVAGRARRLTLEGAMARLGPAAPAVSAGRSGGAASRARPAGTRARTRRDRRSRTGSRSSPRT